MTVYRSCSSFFIVDHEKASVFPTGLMSVCNLYSKLGIEQHSKLVQRL